MPRGSSTEESAGRYIPLVHSLPALDTWLAPPVGQVSQKAEGKCACPCGPSKLALAQNGEEKRGEWT